MKQILLFFDISKKLLRRKLAFFTCIISFFGAITSLYAQVPADENYDDDTSFNITSNDFSLDGIHYQITGTVGHTYNHRTYNGALGLSEGGPTDYAFQFDSDGDGGTTSITITASNGSAFQLTSMSMDILSDVDVNFTSNNGGNFSLSPTLGEWIYYQNFDFTSQTGFTNITSFTISGVNLIVDIDDLNFEAATGGATTPVVTTTAAAGITTTTATLGGNVTDDGGATVSDRGVVYNTTGNPTTADTKIQIGTGTGIFSDEITGLTAGTAYFVRAYAINSEGTSYGSEESFTTNTVPVSGVFWYDNFEDSSTPSSGTRTPSNNAGNGGATHSGYFIRTDGSNIDLTLVSDGPYLGKQGTWFWAGEDHDLPFPDPEQSIVWSNIDISGKTNLNFGGLFAAQSTYPAWENVLFGYTHSDYIIVEYSIDGSSYQNLISFYGNSDINGPKQLALDTDGDLIGDGTVLTKAFAEFSEDIPGTGNTLQIRMRVYSNNTSIEEWAIDNFRVEAQAPSETVPTVTTAAPLDITTTTATLGGNVTDDGGATVSDRGVVYNTTGTPTTADTKIQIGIGTGTFSDEITGLTAGTAYFVRAYAINSEGTSYGSEESFTTLLACPTGNVVLTSQTEVNAFGTNYAHCTEILGDLQINGAGITDLSPLNNLEKVGGALSITDTDLTQLSGLASLISIGGEVIIDDNGLLTSLAGLDNVATIGGNLTINLNTRLDNLDNLVSLTSIGGYLRIANNSSLISTAGLSSVSNIGGDIMIVQNYLLTQLDGFSSLTNLSGYLDILGNPLLAHINSLSSVTTIADRIRIQDNNELANLNGLSSVTSIGGFISLQSNASLVNLNGLLNLESIGDYIFLNLNDQLQDITGLANIDPATIDGTGFYGLYIVDNPLLSVCNLPNFCEYLSDPGNARTISGNLDECLNEAAVLAACGATLPYNETQGIYTLTIQEAVEASDCGVLSTVVIPSGDYNSETVDTTDPCWDINFKVGASPGCATIGSITLNNTDSLEIEIEGLTACTEFDQYEITGALALGGATLNPQFLNSYAPDFGDSWIIFDNTFAGSVNGTFAGLAEGATLTVAGFELQITYVGGDGNDIVLTATACPDIITTDVATNQEENIVADCEYEFTWTEPTFTGGCGVTVTRTLSPTYAVSDPYAGGQTVTATVGVGVTTVTYTAEDASGNTETFEFTLTANDVYAPAITCNTNQTIDADAGVCTYTHSDLTWDATATDNCSVDTITYQLTGDTTGNGSSLNGVTFNLGVTNVTWTATDESGNTDSCSFTVTVEDAQNPTIACTTNQLVDADAGVCTYTHSDLTWDATATDNCSVDTITYQLTGDTTGNGSSLNGVTFNLGVTNVTWTAIDESGNTDSCNFTVTVEDNTAPIASCAAPFTIQLDANGEASITVNDIDSGSTDNCAIDTLSIDITDFDCSHLGDNSVTLTVTDTSGNTGSCTTTITVADTMAPSIACPADITVSTDAGNCSATVNFATPLAMDNCSLDTLVQTDGPASGSQFPVGVTLIGFTATDTSGNTSSCTFNVTVGDNEAPIAVCQNITVQLDEFGLATISAADLDGGSSDACGIDLMAIGQSTFDCTNVGDNNVLFTVTDINGNASSCTAIVTVQDVTAPQVSCQDITVQLDAGGAASITGANIDNGSTDACGIATYSLDMDTFDCSNIGENTVTLTVTDVNGNSASCSATVTVEDLTAPELACSDFTLELGADGTATLLPANVIATGTDACGIATTAVDITEFDCSDIGTPVTVQVFASDINGNISTCSAVVTVVDAMAPIVSCPADQTVDPGIGNLFYEVPDYFAIGEASAIDNCTDPATITSQEPAAGEFLGDGVHIVTLSAEDGYGNIGTCTFELTVKSVLGVTDYSAGLENITMYPVPAKDFITISNPANMVLEKLEIYDLRGRLVQKENLRGMGISKPINIKSLASASYYVKITSENGQITKRLLKE